MARLPECVVVADGAEFVLLGRHARVEHARGTEAELRALAAGRYEITDAPLLEPVELLGTTRSGDLEFGQRVDENIIFQGRKFFAGVTEWIDAILFPDHLGVAFTERLADLPRFVEAVQLLSGVEVRSVRGTGSVAVPPSPPLLGDWIRSNRFDADRLSSRFEDVLGGSWTIVVTMKVLRKPENGYRVGIERVPGS